MLDKNPEQILDSDFSKTRNQFSKTNPNIILCSKPFLKSSFLIKLIDSVDCKVIYLDFDLLYSGYVASGLVEKNKQVTIIHPDRDSWEKELPDILDKISREKILVIIDSLNGMSNLFAEKDSARFVNASVMLLASLGNVAGSIVVVSCMARKREEEWIMVPGGRQLVGSKNTGLFLLRSDSSLSSSDTDSEFVYRT